MQLDQGGVETKLIGLILLSVLMIPRYQFLDQINLLLHKACFHYRSATRLLIAASDSMFTFFTKTTRETQVTPLHRTQHGFKSVLLQSDTVSLDCCNAATVFPLARVATACRGVPQRLPQIGKYCVHVAEFEKGVMPVLSAIRAKPSRTVAIIDEVRPYRIFFPFWGAECYSYFLGMRILCMHYVSI